MNDHGESGEWTTPFANHPTRSRAVYAGLGNVWRSDNGDSRWTQMSDFAPAPGTTDYVVPMSALSISPADTSYIYLAKRISHPLREPTAAWMTSNSGLSWRDITDGLPDSLYLTSIATDQSDPNTAWAGFGGFSDGVKVYMTNDGGTSWVNVSQNLPNLPVNTVVQFTTNRGSTVFVGTDVGVYYSSDDSDGWVPLSRNLPNAIVSDLELHHASRTLYAATFGRGVWAVDLSGLISGVDATDNVASDLRVRVLRGARSGEVVITTTSREMLKGASIEIVDVLGRRVHMSEVDINSGDSQLTLSAALTHGLYFLRLTHPNGTTRVERFVIED
ncbi:MAG: T9SS type A sorting domain-containing protein [bacterium]|nr:T9SS type A sorting domain-containing protein [Candidatus Kapabacteria bacterium]